MTVFFRPCGNITKAPTPRGERDEALYEDLMKMTGITIEVDASVDYEDWMEPACMLQEALVNGLETKILPQTNLRRAVMNPIVEVAGKPCRDMLIGRQLKSDQQEMAYFDLGWPAACDLMANHYAELETFHRHAGRKIALADMPGDPNVCGDRKTVFRKGLSSTSLGDAMSSVSPGPVMVKQVYPGKILPILTYELGDDFTPDKGKGLFLDDVGFHFARYEGDPASLLVQEKIVMTHETRFFVIDGKPTSGAACIESNTPQQTPHHDDVLPPIWEIERNSGNMDDRRLRDRNLTALHMWNFVHDVCAEIAEEAPELTCYVIDIALGADNMPLVIELNPAASSGIYANNSIKIFEAIMKHSVIEPLRETAPWEPSDFANQPFIQEEKPAPSNFTLADFGDDEEYSDDDTISDAEFDFDADL